MKKQTGDNWKSLGWSTIDPKIDRDFNSCKFEYNPVLNQELKKCLLNSDVDPDPVGFTFIWVIGSGSRGIK